MILLVKDAWLTWETLGSLVNRSKWKDDENVNPMQLEKKQQTKRGNGFHFRWTITHISIVMLFEGYGMRKDSDGTPILDYVWYSTVRAARKGLSGVRQQTVCDGIDLWPSRTSS